MTDVAKPPQKRNFRRTQGAQNRSESGPKNNSGQRWKLGSSESQSGLGDASEANDDQDCIVCAEHIVYAAVSPCNHVVCHKCAFRQRALYAKKSCLVCRTEVDNVIFCKDKDAAYETFSDNDITEFNEKYGASFVSKEIALATLGLLHYNCPFGDTSDLDFGSFKKYNAHLKNDHNKTLCMICASHKKAFPRELKIYTPNQLRVHQSKGDVEGFTGHPMCDFCSGQRFYSEDELNIHLRDKHERCHICDRIDSTKPQYLKDYDQLFEHFKATHYVCTVQSCLDNKFVVFQDEIDLQAHILKEHGNILRNGNNSNPSGGARKYQSRLSTFSQPNSRNSSSQRLDKHSEPGNTEDSLEMKTKRMQERARHYLNYSHTDYEQFLAINEGFKNRMITAEDLYGAYQSLFKSPEANTALLLYDFSELFFKNSQYYKDLRSIYDSEQKKQDRETNFPSLSASSPSLLAGNVVSGSWGRTAGSAKPAARQYNFPALKKPVHPQPILKPKPVSYGKVNNASSVKNPMAAVRKSPSAEPGDYKPTYLDSKSSGSSSSPSLDKKMFPPLPQSQGKKFRAPLVNGSKIVDPSQWGKISQSPQGIVDAPSGNSFINETATGSRKKNKQKQLLFHIGI
ncbi:LANO_0B04610g1_1 [Lachancea nothofagi CBS 11611]|uniref:RING-type E3 ubiquitin transferase n=1 Tax=Lachancea nothofagi CBS 11611 TaxID=1266666 RepID=A0A1G4IYB2_9SACH|nr:LANO_0B04610g1_1 [Lachancea nothofagi CBS 11611]